MVLEGIILLSILDICDFIENSTCFMKNRSYILVMINQIISSFWRGGGIRASGRLFTLKRVSFMSGGKDNGEEKDGETVISLTKQDIERMKAIMKQQNQAVIEGENSEGEHFFEGEEARLSLKLLQLDSLEQLKPLIIQYSKKSTEVTNNLNQITRCKFFILLKYVNLEGYLLSSQISPLFRDIAVNFGHLDEDIFTVFLRFVANDESAIKTYRQLLPKVPLFPNPSHTNSELLSLLLMIYPQAKEQIYIHYHLLPIRKAEGEAEKPVVYDPVNITHILSHYYYYDDVQKLFESMIRTQQVEDSDAYLEEFIKTDEDFQRRKMEALVYAVSHQHDHIYRKYLTEEFFNFVSFGLRGSVSLLKALILSEKASIIDNKSVTKQCSSQLIRNILQKTETFITDEQGQIQQNEAFQAIGEIIANYLRKKPEFIVKDDIIQLIKCVFNSGQTWNIKFELYSVDDLFSLIVSYKASKDFLTANNQNVDSNGVLFASMLTSFNAVAAQADQKQLFYVCMFANQLSSIRFLRSKAVMKGISEFSKRKELSEAVRQQIREILIGLEGIQ